MSSKLKILQITERIYSEVAASDPKDLVRLQELQAAFGNLHYASQGDVDDLIYDMQKMVALVGQNSAMILYERIVRATRDTAFAQTTSLLQASVGHNTARIEEINTAFSTANSAMASRLNTVEARLGNISDEIFAQVTIFTQSLVNEQQALAQQVTDVRAGFSGTIGHIQEQVSAMVAANGQVALHWGIKFDVNGRVVGAVTMDGTAEHSSFYITVDKFGIVNPLYPANLFPSKVIISANSGTQFQTNLGTGAANVFINVGEVANAQAADVFVIGSMKGVGVGTGFDSTRLRYAGINTFVPRFSGQCRNATLWYRIPTQSNDWKVLAAMGWLAPTSGTGDFHSIVLAGSQRDIAVAATETIEFGFNGLDGNGNGDTGNDSRNDIWAGVMMVEAVNF